MFSELLISPVYQMNERINESADLAIVKECFMAVITQLPMMTIITWPLPLNLSHQSFKQFVIEILYSLVSIFVQYIHILSPRLYMQKHSKLQILICSSNSFFL